MLAGPEALFQAGVLFKLENHSSLEEGLCPRAVFQNVLRDDKRELLTALGVGMWYRSYF